MFLKSASTLLASSVPTQYHIASVYRLQKWRRIFPLLIAGIICLFLFWTRLEDIFDPYAKTEEKIDPSVLIHNRLVAPRLLSVDEKGHTYSISAASVQQQGKYEAHFEKPYLTMALDKNTTIEIASASADYNDLAKSLMYSTDVILSTNTGYKLKTSKVYVDLVKKEAIGNHSVKGEGPMGSIQAQGFSTTENGKIHFKGKTKLIISQKNGSWGKVSPSKTAN